MLTTQDNGKPFHAEPITMEIKKMQIIDSALLDATSAKAKTAPRLRMNHNFHKDLNDPINRMLNAMERGTYIPVHRHTNPLKTEVIIVLRGSLGTFIFNDNGEITEKAVIDPQKGVYGFEIDPGEWHSLLVLEDDTVVYEIKSGPYTPISANDTAPWTPAPNDTESIDIFLKKLENEIKNF